MMEDCVFCKIIAGEIPSKKLYEDDRALAFYDIDPKAPTHFLIIPKKHISSLNLIDAENSREVAYIFEVIAKLAKKLDLKKGYRVISNCGEDAGQTVPHIHFHVMAGRTLAWPAG